MRSLVVIACLCAGWSVAAGATPRYTRPASKAPMAPAVAAAEALWTEASREPDTAKAGVKWKAAARAFDAAAAATDLPTAVRAEAAYAAVLSWKNAIDTDPVIRTTPHEAVDEGPPRARPLDEDDAALVAALGHYLELMPTAPDVAEIRFVRANVLRRYHHVDEALPDLIELIEHHRDHEVAEYAMNILLDLLIRSERYDEMIAWVRLLAADAGYLRAHPDLADRLRMIERQWLRKQAETAERDARLDDDPDAYLRCAATYDQGVALAPKADGVDELLYNAGVCLEDAGDADGALARYQRILDLPGRSPLVPKAIARSGQLTRAIGHLADAATWLERYARTYAGEHDARDAMLDAIALRAGLGQTDLAAHDARWLVKTYGAKRRADGAAALADVVAAHLDHGERAAARKLAVDLVRVGRDHGELVWEAACPIATTDGLCRRRGRVRRDPRLARAALARLAASPDPRAHLLVASATLEEILGARRVDVAKVERARAAYELVVGTSDTDPDAAILAHAHLGVLAEHLREPEPARASFTRCAQLAIAASRPDRLAMCDDGLRQLGWPTPVVLEHLPHAQRSTPSSAPEPPALREPSPRRP